MNKPANQTKLGRLLLNEKISNEAQLNSFIVNNFSNNLFDFKDYEDTIEYFREPIKLFDCNSILNSIVSHYSSGDSCDETRRSESELFAGDDSSSISSDLSKGNANDTTSQKSYLRFIYDWLKWFHYLQTTNSNSYRLSSSLYQSPNPAGVAGVAAASANAGPTPSSQSFIFRKNLTYHTKYNLTNLLREIEAGMKEMCNKCDITKTFYSFKNANPSGNVSHHDISDMSNENIFIENDDFDCDKNFANLRQTSFESLNNNLSRMENMIVTMNAEYNSNQMLASTSSSINSATTNITQVNSNSNNSTYNRVPSFSSQEQPISNKTSTNSTPTAVVLTTSATSSGSSSNNSHSTLTHNNIMSKSISSMSGGDLESSLSLSLSLGNLQLKRTYCFLIVNAKLKTLTFYAFTTESANYSAIKQLLDQSAETIKQRYHLVNNTILYKYGGLIGDNLLYDFKKGIILYISDTNQLKNKKESYLNIQKLITRSRIY
jgi:hypothetical protein